VGNLTGGEDAVLPSGLVGLFDSLVVEGLVDLFEELEADDAVVGAFVGAEDVGSSFGLAVVEVVDAVGVEDFVYAFGGG